MPSLSPRSTACPRLDCTSAVTYATESEVHAGAPLWQCQSQHHGPHFVGFDGYHS